MLCSHSLSCISCPTQQAVLRITRPLQLEDLSPQQLPVPPVYILGWRASNRGTRTPSGLLKVLTSRCQLPLGDAHPAHSRRRSELCGASLGFPFPMGQRNAWLPHADPKFGQRCSELTAVLTAPAGRTQPGDATGMRW